MNTQYTPQQQQAMMQQAMMQQQMHQQQAAQQYAMRQAHQQQTPTRAPQQQRVQYASPSNPPPAKRARPTPPTAMQETIEDEEDTSRGDILDHLTPREISEQRFVQHDKWMEEVLGSVYSINQITPGKLGLENLAGDLKSLVDGLYSMDGAPTEGRTRDEVAKTVGERAKTKTLVIEGDMEEMKRNHQRTIEKIKKGTMLMKAERELRGAGIVDIDDHLGLKEKADDAEMDTVATKRVVDTIVAEVEKFYNVTISEVQMVHPINPDGTDLEPEDENAMTGVTASDPTSPGTRVYIPVVSSSIPNITAEEDKDTTMEEADAPLPLIDLPTTSVLTPPLAPIQTPASLTAPSAPPISAPTSVHVTPSPSPLPSPLPATATAQPELHHEGSESEHISRAPTSADEPPTVPDEESVPEGFAGGEVIPEGFMGGDSVGEALDLLGETSTNFQDALNDVERP